MFNFTSEKELDEMKGSSFTEREINLIEKEIRTIEDECYSKVMKLQEKKKAIREINIYSREQSADIIAYLVSKMEEKRYIVSMKSFSLYKRRENEKINYTLTYLVEKGKEKSAEKTIRYIFDQASEIANYSDDYIDSFFVGSSRQYDFRDDKFLDFPQHNYIQLSYYKTPADYISNYDYYRITDKIIYLKEHGLNRSWGMENGLPVGLSNICDEKYNYIVDFMDFVTEYKLENFDFNPTKQTMMQLVGQFIREYQKNKSTVKVKQTKKRTN